MIVTITRDPYIEHAGGGEIKLEIRGMNEITGRAFKGAYVVNLEEIKPPLLRNGEVVELCGGFDRFTSEFKISEIEIVENFHQHLRRAAPPRGSHGHAQLARKSEPQRPAPTVITALTFHQIQNHFASHVTKSREQDRPATERTCK